MIRWLPTPSLSSPFAARLAQMGALAAILTVGRLVAVHHPDPASAAEAGYLAFLAAWVVAALSLSSRTAVPVVVGATLFVPLLLMPGAEGTRGAAALAMLVVLALTASWRALAGGEPGLAELAALLLGWHALLRTDRFLDLAPGAETLVSMLVLPIAAAFALLPWARREGWRPPAIVAAALLPLTSGVGVVVLACLVLGALRATVALEVRWRIAGSVAAVATASWRAPEAAVALALAALVLELSRWERWRAIGPLVASAWALWQWLQEVSLGPESALVWLTAALAAWPLALAGRRTEALAGVALVLAASSAAALAPALLLVGVVLGRGQRTVGPQLVWSGGWLALATVALAYPWWRLPVDLPMRLLPPVAWLAVLLLTAVAVALPRRRPLALAGIVVSIALALGAAPRALLDEPQTLPLGKAWRTRVEDRPVRELIVDSLATAPVEPRAAVARVRLRRPGTKHEWVVRAGQDTDFFGAAVSTSRPWLTWIGPDRTLVRRFRSRWEAPERLPEGAVVELVRPEKTGLAAVDWVVLGVAVR